MKYRLSGIVSSGIRDSFVCILGGTGGVGSQIP